MARSVEAEVVQIDIVAVEKDGIARIVADRAADFDAAGEHVAEFMCRSGGVVPQAARGGSASFRASDFKGSLEVLTGWMIRVGTEVDAVCADERPRIGVAVAGQRQAIVAGRQRRG